MELSYIGVEVSDRQAFNDLLRNVVGLVPGEDTSDGVPTWRNDHKVHRVIVLEGPRNDALFFGLEVAPGDFDGVVARVRNSGGNVVDGSPEDLANRRVDRLARISSPWGVTVEIVTGLADAAQPFDSPLVPGGFRTEGVGFGHIVFQVADAEQLQTAHKFATEVLGFTQSDWFEGNMGPVPVVAHFYHCNPRHHTLALGYSPLGAPPFTLNHIMVETVSEENVGAAYDRAWLSGVPLDNGLGRHDNDQMFSFYMRTPAGFRIEFGYGAREITSPWTGNRLYDRPSIWGHLPVERPALQEQQ